MTQREIADMLDRLSRRTRHKYPARKLREEAGLTLQQLGGLIGATGSSVCRWETGLKFPRSAAGIRWARQVREWERQAWLATYGSPEMATRPDTPLPDRDNEEV
jgi:transcriptional regulator with XRE-family HTH domain